MRPKPKVVYIDAHRQKENKRLLEQVFRQQGPVLRQFFRARQLSDQDCEDLIQELLLRLAGTDNLDEKLSDTSGSTVCYLLSIATNLMIDRKRKAAVRKGEQHDSYDRDYLPAENASPEAAVCYDRQVEKMMVELKKLKPKCRDVFVMSRFKGMSHKEIARAMKFSEASVERYMAIALVALRKGLKS